MIGIGPKHIAFGLGVLSILLAGIFLAMWAVK